MGTIPLVSARRPSPGNLPPEYTGPFLCQRLAPTPGLHRRHVRTAVLQESILDSILDRSNCFSLFISVVQYVFRSGGAGHPGEGFVCDVRQIKKEQRGVDFTICWLVSNVNCLWFGPLLYIYTDGSDIRTLLLQRSARTVINWGTNGFVTNLICIQKVCISKQKVEII